MVTKAFHTADELLDLLSDIPDPEIPVITIRELGMLQGVKPENNGYVVTITPTYTACPAMKLVEDEILGRCSEHGISNVRVELTYTPAWSTDWLSSGAKEKLRQYGIAPPEQENKACTSTFGKRIVTCPRCGSRDTELVSRFGSTACKSLHSCKHCKEPFEYFKCH